MLKSVLYTHFGGRVFFFLSWMDIEFYQMFFMHLLRWSFDFCLFFCWCGIYDTFEHFLKTKEYNYIGWLLLMLLHRVVKENLSSGIQIPAQTSYKWLKSSTCVVKEILISCSHRTVTAENQTWNIILRLAEL